MILFFQSSRCHMISGGAVKSEWSDWLEQILECIFTWTLERNILGPSDWKHAILDLFESPCLGLYMYQISDGLDRWGSRYFVSKMGSKIGVKSGCMTGKIRPDPKISWNLAVLRVLSRFLIYFGTWGQWDRRFSDILYIYKK
jgi:hypothetical protein